MEQMSYKAPGLALDDLVEAVSKWFQEGGFETQALKSSDGGVMIQARQEGTIRSILGMASALSVKIIKSGDDLHVELGAAKWAESASVGAAAAAGTLATFGLWPAFITAAYGSWKQSQLPAQVFKAVEEYITAGQITVKTEPLAQTELMNKIQQTDLINKFQQTVSMNKLQHNDLMKKLPFASRSKIVCPACGQMVNEESKFCNQCGANLKMTCKCGAALNPQAKFCENCGSPVSRT
jgi:hypothetical protein